MSQEKNGPKGFTSKKEAEIHLARSESLLNLFSFCPLVKEMCKNNCICFGQAVIILREYGDDKGKYFIHPPYCSNKMFWNES